MRIRTRSYAAAFAASAGVAVTTEALRTPPTPRLLSPQLAIRSTTCSRTSTTHTPCSASRTDADTEADTINIRRKSYGAPVVDSTLLRFISQQKKTPGVFSEASVVITKQSTQPSTSQAGDDELSQEARADLDATIRAVMGYEEETAQTTSESTSSFEQEDSDAYDSTTQAIKEKLTGGFVDTDRASEEEPAVAQETADFNSEFEFDAPPTSSTSWMAQFGASKVAALLLEEGDLRDADEALAQQAGDAVERYCVVRTARRRIRRFLKERDTLWASSGGSSSSRSELESLAASDMATSPAASLLLTYAETSGEDDAQLKDDEDEDKDLVPAYGFADVLEVLREYGLTTTDLCVLLTHSPNLALRVPRKSFLRKGQTDEAETLEETLERSLKGLLMETLGLRRYDARKVLRTCPGLLSVRGSQSAGQVVTIMTKLGVSTKSLARDKHSLPVLLSRSPSGLFRLVAFLSSTAIRMPLEQIGPLLRRRVGRELMDALLPVPNTSYSKVGGNHHANANHKPAAAAQDDSVVAEEATLQDDAAAWSRTRMERQEGIEKTYSSMTQTARILKAQIGTQDLTKVVAAYPQVLLLDAEKQILPVARYLMGGLGIWQNDLAGVLQLYPTLLGTKIDDLERVVSYVLTLGVDEDDLAGIFRAFPGLFSLEISAMDEVVQYLERIGVEDIGAFVTKLPPILGYSVQEDLEPKWEFLKTVCLQPEFELKEFPAYFSYPFERVIKTRFNYLAYKGISIRFVSMRIDTVLRFGDVDFATKVALDDDYGRAFRAFAGKKQLDTSKTRRNPPNGHFGSNTRHNNASNRNHKNGHKPARPVKHNYASRKNEAKAALAAAQRLSEDIDNAKDLSELNRIFRKAAPLRNRSLENSLPSLKPSRPKKNKQKRKNHNTNTNNNKTTSNDKNEPKAQQGKKNNRNNNPGGEEGSLPQPA